jgi:hypothetical protein
MANKTIADLTVKNPASSDILPVADPSSGLSGKSTVAQLFAAGLPNQSGNSGKFLTTNGTDPSWSNNPLGTVTQVQGTGTINGITLTGNVTSNGNLTLGGALSGVNLATQTTGVLSVTNGGTGTTDGSITGTGALTIAAGGTNQNVTILPSGTGTIKINNTEFITQSWPYGAYSLLRTAQRTDDGDGGHLYIYGPNAKTSGAGGSVSIGPGSSAGGGARGYVAIDGVTISNNSKGITVAIGSTAVAGQGNVGVGYRAGDKNDPSSVTGRNVFIGYEAGLKDSGANDNTSGVDSVCVGYRAYPNGASDTNSIVIGYNAIGAGSNTAVIGNSSVVFCQLSGYTKTKSLQETVFAITDGASVDINPANGGIQTWTLGANRTPTASSFAEGQSVTLMIDDGTAYAITWSSVSPTWIGGSAPTLATSGYTVIELWKRSTTIYGALVGTA